MKQLDLTVRERMLLYSDPLAHALLAAVGAGALAAAAAGPLHGWAAFAGLAAHLLHDAGDRAAPTPLLWPWAPPRQLGRGRALAGTTALALGSWIVSRAGRGRAGHSPAGAGDGDGEAALPRTG